MTAEDLDRLNSDLATRYVSAWFEPLAALPVTSEADESVRLAAFRIALAVLNESPFDLVAEAAENLTDRILHARSPRRTPGRPVFARIARTTSPTAGRDWCAARLSSSMRAPGDLGRL